MIRRLILVDLNCAAPMFAADATGTMVGDQFEQPIKDGEIKGDDISFSVHIGPDGADLKFTGKVSGGKIEMTAIRAIAFVASKAESAAHFAQP